MMPYAVKRELHPHLVCSSQFMYSSLPGTPIYDQSQHHQQQQQHHHHHHQHHHPPAPAQFPLQDHVFSNGRPLFRNHSTSSFVPTHHTNQENLLRRKTPSGTLAAAYDAAPVELTGRPTKQILLPYHEARHGRSAVLPPDMGASRGLPLDGPWPTDKPAAAADAPCPLGSMDVPASNANLNLGIFSADWPLPAPQSAVQVSLDDNLDPFVRQFLLQQQQQLIAPPFPPPDPLWTGCQYSGFQPLYSPIPPPTASCDEADGYLMGVGYHPVIPRDSFWQPHQLAWGSGQSTPSAQLPQAVVNLNLNPPPPPLHYIDDAQPCTNGWPHHPCQASLHGSYPRQSPPSLQLPLPLHPSPYDQPSLFGVVAALPNSNNDSSNNLNLPQLSREKVGVRAYKAYVDLLASIHAQKRQHEGGSSAKTGLYPRPPRISGLKKNAFRPQFPSISSVAAATAASPPLPTLYGGHDAALGAPDRRKRLRASVGGGGGGGASASYHPDIGTSSSHSTQASGSGGSGGGHLFPTPVGPFRRHSSATGHRFNAEARKYACPNLPAITHTFI